MATSNWQNISFNINLIRKLDPKSILDIGVGFGRWGILFREFLEIWDDLNFEGNWKRRIDGVEIYSEYIKEYHKYFYTNIFIDDALTFLKNTEFYYDLINCGDVIEHFEKKDGKEFIELCLQKSKYVIINIPIGKYWSQNVLGKNPYEAHRSVWYNNDFTKYKNNIIKSFRDLEQRDYSVILLSNDKIRFTAKYGKYFHIKNFLKHRLGLKILFEKLGK